VKDKHKLISYTLLLALGAVWGSSFIIMKKVNPVFSPIQISSLRLLFAGSAALPLVYKSFKSFSKTQWRDLIIVGIIGNAIPSLLFAIASKGINSATSGILNGLSPIFTLLLGILFFNFKAKIWHYTGAFMGIVGCILVLQGNDSVNIGHQWIYFSLPILGSFCYGISVNVLKSRLSDINPVITGATPFLFGAILGLIALPVSTIYHPLVIDANFLQALGLLAILGVVGSTLSMILFNRLVQLNSAIFASSVTFIMPAFALLWGIWDMENIRILQIVGMVIILVAVYVIRQGDRIKKLL